MEKCNCRHSSIEKKLFIFGVEKKINTQTHIFCSHESVFQQMAQRVMRVPFTYKCHLQTYLSDKGTLICFSLDNMPVNDLSDFLVYSNQYCRIQWNSIQQKFLQTLEYTTYMFLSIMNHVRWRQSRPFCVQKFIRWLKARWQPWRIIFLVFQRPKP